VRQRLGAWAIFAGVISAAGLPLYIHAPKFYVDSYGVSLAALGTVLFALRLIDVVQDPALGWLAVRVRAQRGLAVAVAAAVMAGGLIGLFAIAPPVAPLLWFALMLVLVFSGFSFLSITFYATGVAKANAMPGQGHLRLARWRESGALLGICLAAILPSLFEAAGFPPFAGFAAAFALVAAVAVWAMRGEWHVSLSIPSTGFGPVLRDPLARRLLGIAFLNAAPVAASSTLFLFFVEDRLGAPGWEGPLLLLFFLAAALAAPVWSVLAERYGTKAVLLAAMVLAIFAFGGALALRDGDVIWFALVCFASGAALGADMTLLPALFARRMSDISPGAGEGFALWAFMQKLTLAFSAVVLLPTLEAWDFRSGSANPPEALWALSLAYAGLPCVLKLFAIAVLATTKIPEDSNDGDNRKERL